MSHNSLVRYVSLSELLDKANSFANSRESFLPFLVEDERRGSLRHHVGNLRRILESRFGPCSSRSSAGTNNMELTVLSIVCPFHPGSDPNKEELVKNVIHKLKYYREYQPRGEEAGALRPDPRPVVSIDDISFGGGEQSAESGGFGIYVWNRIFTFEVNGDNVNVLLLLLHSPNSASSSSLGESECVVDNAVGDKLQKLLFFVTISMSSVVSPVVSQSCSEGMLQLFRHSSSIHLEGSELENEVAEILCRRPSILFYVHDWSSNTSAAGDEQYGWKDMELEEFVFSGTLLPGEGGGPPMSPPPNDEVERTQFSTSLSPGARLFLKPASASSPRHNYAETFASGIVENVSSSSSSDGGENSRCWNVDPEGFIGLVDSLVMFLLDDDNWSRIAGGGDEGNWNYASSNQQEAEAESDSFSDSVSQAEPGPVPDPAVAILSQPCIQDLAQLLKDLISQFGSLSQKHGFAPEFFAAMSEAHPRMSTFNIAGSTESVDSTTHTTSTSSNVSSLTGSNATSATTRSTILTISSCSSSAADESETTTSSTMIGISPSRSQDEVLVVGGGVLIPSTPAGTGSVGRIRLPTEAESEVLENVHKLWGFMSAVRDNPERWNIFLTPKFYDIEKVLSKTNEILHNFHPDSDEFKHFLEQQRVTLRLAKYVAEGMN